MFKDRYQKAYGTITPSQELIADTIEKVGTGKKSGRGAFAGKRFVLQGAITAAAIVLCFGIAVPVCAAYVPAFYQIVEYFSPALADELVPIEKSSTSQGITMQVEAIYLAGKEAEIIISLQDAENSMQDLVHGEMDLYGSYGLSDYTNDSIIGGCHFLTYDEKDDKAYFQVNVQSDNAYRSDKLRFSASEILCDKGSVTKEVSLSDIVYEAETKRVALSGSGGGMDEKVLPESLQDIPGTAENPRSCKNVLDMMEITDCAADDFTITGIAYMDGVLRVQMCMGDNESADRHVQLFLRNAEGNERYPDRSVSWKEDVEEIAFTFYEFWYLEEIEDIADYSMYGIFHSAGELVRGDWNVVFRLEEN